MQSIRQYRKLQAGAREVLYSTDLAKIEQSIDAPSSSDDDYEKHIPGVHTRSPSQETQKEHVFVVGWDGDHDPLRPRNWSLARRWIATVMLCMVSIIVSAASSIDSAVTPQSSEAFHVEDDVGSLTTGKETLVSIRGATF